MEVHDPPNHARYCELVCPSAAGRIEFLSFSPANCLHKVNFRVADDTSTIIPRMRLNPMLRYKYDIRQAESRQCQGRAMRNPTW